MVSTANVPDVNDNNSEPSQLVARPVTPLGILVEQLEHLVDNAKSESVSAKFKEDLRHTYLLAAGLDPYLEDCTTPESAALANLTERTQKENWGKRFDDGETAKALEQEMLSGHLEGQLLKMLVAMSKSKHVLEIGVFTGYSALAIAESLPEDGSLVACEVDEYAANFAQECFNFSEDGKKIDLRVAPAIETMKQLLEDGKSFDLAFIDADKGGYIDYLNLLVDTSLLAEGGFICVDNTLMQGQPYLSEDQRTENGKAITHFNRFVAEDSRVEQVMIPIRDGLTIIKRK